MLTLDLSGAQPQSAAALQDRLADLIGRRDILVKAIDELVPPPGRELGRGLAIQRSQLVQQVRTMNVEIETIEFQLGRLGVTGAPPAIPATPVAPAVPTIPGTSFPPPQGPDFGLAELGGILGVFVLAPLAIAIAWRIIRRGGPSVSKQELTEQSDRLRRIEEAVDAIAIEVERVSEGQRFITRALGEGEARPISKPSSVPEVARKARAADGT